MHEYASGARYEGRTDLGNVHTGDGVRFKGRGLIQLTGRANYRIVGKTLGLPLEQQPELASDPATAVKIACEFWKRKHINHLCDADNVVHVTRRVNGGLLGLANRKIYLAKAKAALKGDATLENAPNGIQQFPILTLV